MAEANGLESEALARWYSPAVGRLANTIGDQWHTAGHTLPSLVQDDVNAGRVIQVGGLELSMTECALLLG
ncbi:MAG: hypothetical protein EOO38_14295 [Cytophagaceae bacterium]|nr:MAG: hypothetical protein EOO38_14295 [Cytophagaceae bacterium]